MTRSGSQTIEARIPRRVNVRPVGEAVFETVAATPPAVADAMARAAQSGAAHGGAAAVLVIDAEFPAPEEGLVARLLDGPADVWHAGVALGLDGQPRMWDTIDPLSMFSARVDPTIEVTSWRVSLRATLVRTAVLDQLGGPDPGFGTLVGAGLDAGLRWIRGGALVRHVPALVPAGATEDDPPSIDDAVRLVTRQRGRMWAGWALQRTLARREAGVLDLPRLARQLRRETRIPSPEYRPVAAVTDPADVDRTVTVVLPTVDRYPYLVPLLGQLQSQTVAPRDVIIVDQTPVGTRRHDLTEVAPGLPVAVVEIPEPGQSTARNAAISLASGDTLLFIDDDDDVPPTLIADHLARLRPGIDASSGAVDDATAGPPPVGFRHRRVSDVFPTNNTLLRRSALERSGMFDPAFDRGSRADHDLGMRLHLSGAQLVYDPDVEVFHHHAPVGGLRTHGARTTTRASARRSLTERNLPSVTELYLGRKYFTDGQRAEGRRIALLSVLSGEGSSWRRIQRAVVQLVLLPWTWRHLRDADRAAAALFATRPPTPGLKQPGSGEQ